MIRRCINCGAEFEPTNRFQWCCSDKCRGRKYRVRKCERCGKEFSPTSGRQRFCSTKCCKVTWKHNLSPEKKEAMKAQAKEYYRVWRAANKEKLREYYRGQRERYHANIEEERLRCRQYYWWRKAPLAERQCAYCGATFKPRRSDQKYCSGKCCRKAFHGNMTPERRAYYEEQRRKRYEANIEQIKAYWRKYRQEHAFEIKVKRIKREMAKYEADKKDMGNGGHDVGQ